jgi:3D (Asp-Asp-Asp) domain-containing protein/septal ring factor EnvC (AmiA/AmiB activator)
VRAAGPTRAARILVAILAVVTAGVTSGVGGADRASELRSRASELRNESSRLAEESHAALLQLYALESQLASARSRVDALTTQEAAVRHEQAQVRTRLHIARGTYAAAERGVANRLRALYEQGDDVYALSVILGATSFDDALTRLDRISRLADLDRAIAARATSARRELGRLSRALSTRKARLESIRSQAEAAAASFEAAGAERAGYVHRLSTQRQLNDSQIASLETRAQEAQRRSEKAAAAASAAASASPPAPAPAATSSAPPSGPSGVAGRHLTVISTAYSLPGYTASGLPVGPGIVAVDPTVIPMGTRMTIPHYGEGVAADTGSAIKGARIDLWFPTYAQAAAWGAQTVTITLH